MILQEAGASQRAAVLPLRAPDLVSLGWITSGNAGAVNAALNRAQLLKRELYSQQAAALAATQAPEVPEQEADVAPGRCPGSMQTGGKSASHAQFQSASLATGASQAEACPQATHPSADRPSNTLKPLLGLECVPSTTESVEMHTERHRLVGGASTAGAASVPALPTIAAPIGLTGVLLTSTDNQAQALLQAAAAFHAEAMPSGAAVGGDVAAQPAAAIPAEDKQPGAAVCQERAAQPIAVGDVESAQLPAQPGPWRTKRKAIAAEQEPSSRKAPAHEPVHSLTVNGTGGDAALQNDLTADAPDLHVKHGQHDEGKESQKEESKLVLDTPAWLRDRVRRTQRDA